MESFVAFIQSVFRLLQQAFIDMENMFEMLAEKQDVSTYIWLPLSFLRRYVEYGFDVFNNRYPPINKNRSTH